MCPTSAPATAGLLVFCLACPTIPPIKHSIGRRATTTPFGQLLAALGAKADGEGCGGGHPFAENIIFKAFGLDIDHRLDRPAGEVHLADVVAANGGFRALIAKPDHYLTAYHADEHVAVQKEREPAEHLPLGDLAVDISDDAAHPVGQNLVVSHAITPFGR
jgi:hypothetical protein